MKQEDLISGELYAWRARPVRLLDARVWEADLPGGQYRLRLSTAEAGTQERVLRGYPVVGYTSLVGGGTQADELAALGVLDLPGEQHEAEEALEAIQEALPRGFSLALVAGAVFTGTWAQHHAEVQRRGVCDAEQARRSVRARQVDDNQARWEQLRPRLAALGVEACRHVGDRDWENPQVRVSLRELEKLVGMAERE